MYYSADVLAALLLMIVFGAGRTVTIKVYFQMGFDDPFCVTLLMLASHALAVPLYCILRCWPMSRHARNDDDDEAIGDKEPTSVHPPATEGDDSESGVLPAVEEALERPHSLVATRSYSGRRCRVAGGSTTRRRSSLVDSLTSSFRDAPLLFDGDDLVEPAQDEENFRRPPLRGSVTGLTDQSRHAVRWVHRIPGWAKPIVSSFFGFLDATFRVLAVMHLAASVAELLIGGLELILSVVAAKIIRKRYILRQRWYGSAILIVGLALIASSDFMNEYESDSSKSVGLGILFVLLKVIMGVLKDMSQELFMQESDFSATLLLGLEGVYGVMMALPLYFVLEPLFGLSERQSLQFIGQSAFSIGYTIGLIIVLFLAGLFSILGTAVTSAMTRNMWKNFRGLLVWLVALIIFYATGNDELGEPWTIPGSLLILFGFLIMAVGLYVYYRQQPSSDSP